MHMLGGQFQQFYFAKSSVHRMLPCRAHATTSNASLLDAVQEVSACTFAVGPTACALGGDAHAAR